MNRRGKRYGWKPGEPGTWLIGDAHMRTTVLEGLAGRVVRVHGGLHPRFRPQLLVQRSAGDGVGALHDTRPWDLTWHDLGPARRSLWTAQEDVMVEIARLRLGGEP